MPCDVEIAPSLRLRVPFRVRAHVHPIPSADPRVISVPSRSEIPAPLAWAGSRRPSPHPRRASDHPFHPHPPREIVRQMIRPPKRPATFPRPPRDREPPRADRFRRMGPVLGRSQKACTRCGAMQLVVCRRLFCSHSCKAKRLELSADQGMDARLVGWS